MKVIDLLKKADKGEIKKNTFFIRPGTHHSVFGNEVSKYEYVGNNDFMVWFKDRKEKPQSYNILRIGLDAEIEIIEEVEKPKEIEPWGYVPLGELEEKILNVNKLQLYLKTAINTQQDLIKTVNYLLNKKGNRE